MPRSGKDAEDLQGQHQDPRRRGRGPIYEPTAAYGHMGRSPYVRDGIQFFGWEKLDGVDEVKRVFNL